MMRRLGGVSLLSSAAAAVALELLAPERHTALFFASILAIVPLAGLLLLKERMGRRQMAGAALICAGVLLVSLAGR